MDRRNFHRGLAPAALTPAFVDCTRTAPSIQAPDQNRAAAVHRRLLTEYALLSAAQTHELVKLPDAPLVLVSQQSESQLVKLRLDPDHRAGHRGAGLPTGSGRRGGAPDAGEGHASGGAGRGQRCLLLGVVPDMLFCGLR